MEVTLRLEEERDYKVVENVTREAFWNHYVPGCDEHLLIHHLRKAKEFGFGAIIIYGDPEYYLRFGFKASKNYNITKKEKGYSKTQDRFNEISNKFL